VKKAVLFSSSLLAQPPFSTQNTLNLNRTWGIALPLVSFSHPGEGRDLRESGLAGTGTPSLLHEIPAFAGMTVLGDGWFRIKITLRSG
jgi:hypothetical protein